MVAHNVYSFYSPETFLDGTLWFQHSATGQSLGLVISRKNSKNPWSHGPATSCDILRHPATASANITTASQQQTHTNATKTQKLRFEYWESPDCTSSCPTIFIDQRMLVHPQLSSWVADYLNAFAPDERMMNVNNRLKRISRGRIPDLCPVTACRGHEARTGNLLFSWLAKWEVSKVITDVRGTSAHEQIRRGEVAGTLWKVNFEARANGLGVIKSWKYRFIFKAWVTSAHERIGGNNVVKV